VNILEKAADEIRAAIAAAEAEAEPILAERARLLETIERANAKVREELNPRCQAEEAKIAELRQQLSQLQRGRPNARFLSQPEDTTAPAAE
jgi:chromosome segregation ATPase